MAKNYNEKEIIDKEYEDISECVCEDSDCVEYVDAVKCVSDEVDVETGLKKLPPWAIRYYELEALFGEDPDLYVSLESSTRTATITSDNYGKLEALAQVLNLENNGLYIELVYNGTQNSYARTIQQVFNGNPHFDNVRIATEAQTGVKHIITTFKDETIQYAADNRFVPGGYETTLAEKIVKDLFRKEYRRSVYVTKDKKSI